MATRIEKPVVGVTYWTDRGRQYRIYATDGSREDSVHAGELLDDGWRICNFNPNSFSLYDADPTKPEAQAIDLTRKWKFPDDDPLPALDLNKPVKRRDGLPVRNVRQDGGSIAFESLFQGNWICSRRTLAGRTDGFPDEASSDLIQCVRRDWTQADVPFPWPVFRRAGGKGKICALYQVSEEHVTVDGWNRDWKELAKDWCYSTDGKEFNPCCIWE